MSLPIVALCTALAALIVALDGRSARPTASPSIRAPEPLVVRPSLRRLTDEVTLAVTPVQRIVGSSPAATDSGAPTITRVGVAPGDAIVAGAPVVWLDNRPLIALHLPYPLFRDLNGGSVGDDATVALQALRDAGFAIPPGASLASPAARSAIAALYRLSGADPPTIDHAAEIAGIDASLASGDGDQDQLVARRSVLRAEQGPYLAKAEILAISSFPAVRSVGDRSGIGLVPSSSVAVTAVGAEPVWSGQLDGLPPTGDCTLTVGGGEVPCVIDRGQSATSGTAEAAAGGASAPSADNASSSPGAGTGALLVTPTQPVADPHGRGLARIVRSVTDTEVLAVPSNALHTSASGSSVLVRAHGRSTNRPIVTGRAAGGWVEVTSGRLDEDDLLVAGP